MRGLMLMGLLLCAGCESFGLTGMDCNQRSDCPINQDCYYGVCGTGQPSCTEVSERVRGCENQRPPLDVNRGNCFLLHMDSMQGCAVPGSPPFVGALSVRALADGNIQVRADGTGNGTSSAGISAVSCAQPAAQACMASNGSGALSFTMRANDGALFRLVGRTSDTFRVWYEPPSAPH